MRILFLLLVLFSLVSCKSKKTEYVCGNTFLTNMESVDGKVSKFKTVGFADTTVAFVRGQVLGMSSYGDSISVDTLPLALIRFQSIDDSLYKDICADIDGNFKIDLDAGVYNVTIKYFGFKVLKINNLGLGSGEVKELGVILGQGQGITECIVKEDSVYIQPQEVDK